MKTLRTTLLFGIIALVTASCISTNDFQPVENFDIGQPEVNSGPAFYMEDFTIDSRFSKLMFIRTSETTVDYAPYSRWVLSPEQLMQNFIHGASDQNKKVGTLTVNILAVELREKDNTAYFVAEYTLKMKEKIIVQRVASTTTISSFKPELFAKAYRDFTVHLLTDIKLKLFKK